MKLYGTITSERATKGQGGNDYLQIELKDEYQTIFGTIDVYPTEDQYVFVQIHGKKFEARKTKGKK